MGIKQISKQIGYSEYMQKGLKADRMQTELYQMKQFLENLVNVDGKYGTNPSTGQVYDIQILEANIRKHEEDVAYLNHELDESKAG